MNTYIINGIVSIITIAVSLITIRLGIRQVRNE